MFDWFSNLTSASQWLIGLSLLPLGSIVLGLLIVILEPSADKLPQEKGAIVGLLMLGSMAAGYLGAIFGPTLFFMNVLGWSYGVAFGVGLVIGLILVPMLLIFITNKLPKG